MNSNHVLIAKKVAIVALSSLLFACGGGSESVQLESADTPLSVSSGSAITVPPGSSRVYMINGGGGGKTYTNYSATSSNSLVASTSLVGNKLTITGVSNGTANISVMASSGLSYVIATTVPKSQDQSKPLSLAAPESVVLVSNEKPVYEITGGRPPYKATSAAVSVVKSEAAPSNTFVGWELRLTGENAGSSIVNVRDADGTLVTLNVSVVPSSPKDKLYTLAPQSISIVIGANPSYKIGGGVGPYTAVSSAESVATAQVTGTNVVVNSKSVGNATINVYDSLGASVSIVASIIDIPRANGLPLKGAAPTAVTVMIGETPSYSIFGGVPPYKTVSSAESILTSSIQTTGTQSSVLLSAKMVGVANVSIFDSLGDSFTINATVVNVATANPLFTTAPPSVVFSFGESNSFGISGGVKPYSVVSNASGIVTASVINGDTLSLAGVATGNATIYIRDASNTVVQTVVTVSGQKTDAQLYTNAPTSISLAKGSVTTYTIGGGKTPYIIGSGAPGTVSATLVGTTLQLTAANNGNAIITIRDASGTVININATVEANSNSKLFTTAPSIVTLGLGASPSYLIGGGTAPFNATSSDVTRVGVSITGTTFTLTGAAAGSASVIIVDANGESVNLQVVVGGAPSNAPLYTEAPGSISLVKGVATVYGIGGGTAPYTVSSSTPGVMTASISGSSLTVTAVEIGSGKLIVRDSAGTTLDINVAVTAPNANNLYTTAPTSVVILVGAAPTYQIGGGVGPYNAVSSNAAVATTSVSGSTLTITGVSAGTANVVISDTTGASKTIAVTIN